MISYKLFLEQYILNENVLNEIPRNILGMETTYENFPMENPYGFWVDRSGNWIPVKYQGHLDTAMEIIALGNDYLKSKGIPPIDSRNKGVYTILFEAGFMRVTTMEYNCYYELFNSRDKPTTHQQRFLSMCKDMWGEEVKNASVY